MWRGGLKKLAAFVIEWRDNQAALIADFRQFYTLDLPLYDEVDEDLDLVRLALLYEQLPPNSRCKSDEGGWGSTDYMLRSIEYHTRVIAWQNTKDAQKGINNPQPIKSPAERADAIRKRDEALAHQAEIAKQFNVQL